MGRLGDTEVAIYAILVTVFLVYMSAETLLVEPLEDFEQFGYDLKVTILGFWFTKSTDFPQVEEHFKTLPYLLAFAVICLLVNQLDLSYKVQVTEVVSIAMMWHLFGSVVTGVTFALTVLMAVVGRLLRGVKIVPQVLGILTVGHIGTVLGLIPWFDLKANLLTSSLTYGGFYAHVVRAMLICCDYARETTPSSWKSVLSNSIGFAAFTNVFTPASFIMYTDWVQWRAGETKYEWKGPFKLAAKVVNSKATVRRTLSFYNFILRSLRIFVWCLVHKHLLCRFDTLSYIAGPVERLTNNAGSPLDGARLVFCAVIFCGKFNVFYVIFYNLSRLVGDIQQFLLSPAFNQNTLAIVSGDDAEAEKAWKKASFLERWAQLEVEEECLMPEGPCCIIAAFNSSDIWRQFDIGLYNVMKHYIYIPWIETVQWMLEIKAEKDKKAKLSPFVGNFTAVVGAAITFIFVLTFHHWTTGNMVWVSFSFSLWLLERFVVQANRNYRICENLEKRLSPAWEQRIRCLAFALLESVNTGSFLCFQSTYESGIFYVYNILFRPLCLVAIVTYLYLTFNLKLALKK